MCPAAAPGSWSKQAARLLAGTGGPLGGAVHEGDLYDCSSAADSLPGCPAPGDLDATVVIGTPVPGTAEGGATAWPAARV